MTIIPPSSDPNNEPVIFYDYTGTYGDDQRRSRDMCDIWLGVIIPARFPNMRRVPGQAPMYRLVNDQVFIWIAQVMVEAR